MSARLKGSLREFVEVGCLIYLMMLMLWGSCYFLHWVGGNGISGVEVAVILVLNTVIALVAGRAPLITAMFIAASLVCWLAPQWYGAAAWLLSQAFTIVGFLCVMMLLILTHLLVHRDYSSARDRSLRVTWQ